MFQGPLHQGLLSLLSFFPLPLLPQALLLTYSVLFSPLSLPVFLAIPLFPSYTALGQKKKIEIGRKRWKEWRERQKKINEGRIVLSSVIQSLRRASLGSSGQQENAKEE